MNDIMDVIEVNRERATLYNFLASIFRIEADEKLLDTIKSFSFQGIDNDDENDINKGFNMLERYMANINPMTLLYLARDYARVFIGAGLESSGGAYPYESVYTSPDRLLMQEARDEIVKFYSSEKMERRENLNDPEDHIAFEFEFMSYLCSKLSESYEQNNKVDIKKYQTKQENFFNHHINRWVELFCDDVIRISREDFYKAIALITKGFIYEEREYLC